MGVAPSCSIADYDELIDPVSAARAGYNDSQPGDPAKAAAAVLRLLEMDKPPAHLLLGSDALSAATTALRQFADEVDQYRELTMSTDSGATA